MNIEEIMADSINVEFKKKSLKPDKSRHLSQCGLQNNFTMYGITLAQADNGGYTIQDSHEPLERIKPKQRPPRQNAHLDNIYALHLAFLK